MCKRYFTSAEFINNETLCITLTPTRYWLSHSTMQCSVDLSLRLFAHGSITHTYWYSVQQHSNCGDLTSTYLYPNTFRLWSGHLTIWGWEARSEAICSPVRFRGSYSYFFIFSLTGTAGVYHSTEQNAASVPQLHQIAVYRKDFMAFLKHACEEPTLEPHGALLFITVWQQRIGIISCFSAPSLSPPHPPPSTSLRLCLIYPFRSAKSPEMRGICCNALWRCVALLSYVSGQGLVCMRRRRERTANRWWGRTCMAGGLINKINYGNAADETRRCDLSCGHNRRNRVLQSHTCSQSLAWWHLY